MAKTVTFIAEKGGTSRSSIVFSSAWELSKRRKKVLIVDMDGQAANVSFYAGIDKTDILTVVDICKGKDIEKAIVPIKENLDIIPADANLTDLGQSAKLSVLKKAIASIKDNYDFIFVDVNPTPGWTHFLSLSIADGAVIVSLPDISCLEANRSIVESIEEIQEASNPGLSIYGLVFGKNEKRTLVARQVHDVADLLTKRVGTSVFKSSIRNTITMAETVAAHEGITDYATNSLVAEDIREFVDELIFRSKGVESYGKAV